jgi:Zn-dependent protease with chaperone function
MMATGQQLHERLVADPFVAARTVWETADAPADIVEGQLAQKYETTAAGEHRWRGTLQRYWVFTWTLTLTDEGRVHVARELPGWFRVVLLAGVLIAPLLMLTDPATLTLGGLALVLYIRGPLRSDNPPVASCTSIVTERIHPLAQGAVLMIVLGIVALTLQGYPSAFGLLVLAPVLVILAALWYVELGLPGRAAEGQGSRQVLKIPLGMTVILFATLLLFFIVALLAGVLGALADSVAAEAATLPAQAEQPPAAETYDVGALTEAHRGFLTLFGYFLPLFSVILLVLFLLWISDAAETYDQLVTTRLQPFGSNGQRWLAAGLLGGLNLTLIGGAIVGLCVVAYGLTGTLYPPVNILGDLTQLLPPDLQPSTREMVAGLYQALAYNFRELPGLSPRGWSTVVVTLWLWPIGIIVVGTALGVVGRPFRALAALARSDRLSAARGQHLLGDDIQIRTVDLGGVPDAKPMTVLGGWRQYVFVSEVLVETLTDEEFEAVLRHEEYHLQESNRSLLAEALSLLVGGKNALLAFYDYRASERAADDYAARHTSYNTTHDAVEEMYKLAAAADDTADRLGINHPGIVHREAAQGLLEDLQDPGRLRRVFQRLMAGPAATYELYFGGALLDTAHLDPEARLARLRERAT